MLFLFQIHVIIISCCMTEFDIAIQLKSCNSNNDINKLSPCLMSTAARNLFIVNTRSNPLGNVNLSMHSSSFVRCLLNVVLFCRAGGRLGVTLLPCLCCQNGIQLFKLKASRNFSLSRRVNDNIWRTASHSERVTNDGWV